MVGSWFVLFSAFRSGQVDRKKPVTEPDHNRSHGTTGHGHMWFFFGSVTVITLLETLH
jgi:hypothetical protein